METIDQGPTTERPRNPLVPALDSAICPTCGSEPGLDPVSRLTRDIHKAAATLSDAEARFLVDAYYIMQRDRIRADHQRRTLEESKEPSMVLDWLSENSSKLENGVKRALDKYTTHHVVGEWLRTVVGIGPVIAAGLLAHIDINKAPTAGHIFSFAGLNPKQVWNKKEKRPWNAKLKTLCWKASEAFVKVSGKDTAFYGKLYAERKILEEDRNALGDYVDQAAHVMATKNIGKTTEAYGWYSGRVTKEEAALYLKAKRAGKEHKPKLVDVGEGTQMLPPAHVHARVERWTVKLFLSHLHIVWHWIVLDTLAPAPYPVEHMGHVHVIEPPHLDVVPGLEAALAGRRSH